MDDLDMDELKAYVEKVKECKPNFAKNSFEKCLELCGIVAREGDEVYPTLAGIMLFCEYAQMFYPQLFIVCVVVPGYELGNTSELAERFVDNKRVDGTIEQMLQGAINFLNRNMRTSVIFNYGKRTDRQEYPIEALREAIMNALIHRDYSFQTEGSYISLYTWLNSTYLDTIEDYGDLITTHTWKMTYEGYDGGSGGFGYYSSLIYEDYLVGSTISVEAKIALVY